MQKKSGKEALEMDYLCNYFSYHYPFDVHVHCRLRRRFQNYERRTSSHILPTFIVMIIFTGLFYFVFAWFREQVCTLVCPYGRLQGVLIDKETINVFYDFKRGENRAKWRKGEDRKAAGKGDCIDCNQCVVVCPTGIDIRNGQQLECINCTMCIDACDEVMVKTGLPKGLIRYATEDEIEKKKNSNLQLE